MIFALTLYLQGVKYKACLPTKNFGTPGGLKRGQKWG